MKEDEIQENRIKNTLLKDLIAMLKKYHLSIDKTPGIYNAITNDNRIIQSAILSKFYQQEQQ